MTMELTSVLHANINAANISKFNNTMCHPNRVFSRGIYMGESPLNFSIPLMLLQASMAIILTSIVRFVLRPLKQPTIISNVIAGMLLGPSGLGRNKRFAEIVFPPKNFDELYVVALIGAIYSLFLVGVKQDAKVIVNSGRKEWIIAIVGMVIPFVVISTVFAIPTYITHSVEHPEMIIASLSLSAFPSLHQILAELNLLNSKLGRLAMAASTNINVAGWMVLVIFGAIKQATSGPFKTFCYVISLLSLVILIVYVIRPMMFWIVRRTPEGKPVDRAYITAILLGVLVIAFTGDMIGVTVTNGPWMLGLAMPTGPPLGAALVEKTETIVEWFLMPLLYTSIGLRTDVFSIKDWTAWRTLQSVMILGHIAKLVGTMLPSRYFKMSSYDAFSLALIMNLRGMVEIITFAHLHNSEYLNDQSYATLILSTLAITAIATPLVEWLSQNSKSYTPYGLRTIEHSKPNKELRILTCIHTQENVPTIINLLEASHGTRESPLHVWVLNLVELGGRAIPMLVSHKVHKKRSSFSIMPHIKQINNAFRKYEQQSGKYISIQSFTSISPYKTMHEDICMLALEKKLSLIIMPFNKQPPILDQTLRILNSNVLDEAACSVGILVDHGRLHNSFVSNSCYHICIIFLGGADDREALSYGFRMAGHPSVRLDVVRILPKDEDKNNERERQLDDKLVDLFRIKCAGNEGVCYREKMAAACDETINIIRRMKNQYNLMVVGRRHENDSILIQGLSQWCENPELGVIGDFLASYDFSNGQVSVLVLQQQSNVGVAVFNHKDNLHVSQVIKMPFVVTSQ